MKKYNVICDKAFAPYLKNAGCKVWEDKTGLFIETDNPEGSQSTVESLYPGYKLIFQEVTP